MTITEISALLSAGLGLLCTIIVGALTYFMKKTISSLEDADKKNADAIEKVKNDLNDLKADLPLIYTLREDFIRVMANFESKIDELLRIINTRKEG